MPDNKPAEDPHVVYAIQQGAKRRRSETGRLRVGTSFIISKLTRQMEAVTIARLTMGKDTKTIFILIVIFFLLTQKAVFTAFCATEVLILGEIRVKKRA